MVKLRFAMLEKIKGATEMLNRKAQESAPFELLVAVIIMGFVIFIGTKVMNDVQCEKCKNETVAKLTEMATTLGQMGEIGSVKTIDFFLSGCFNQESEMIWVDDEDEEGICAAYHCGAEKRLCTLLKYSSDGCGSFSFIKCVNIGAQADFPSEPGEKCPAKKGWILVDFRAKESPAETLGNKQGTYLLVNGGNETFPIICAYMKRN